MKSVLNQQFGTFWTVITKGTGEYNSTGYSYVNVDLKNRSIEGDEVFTVPVIQPYGLLSVPVDTSNAVGINLSNNISMPVILGDAHTLEAGILGAFDTMVKGETCIYSTNYAVSYSNTGLFPYIKNNQIDTSVNFLCGEWGARILKDLITQFQDLYEKFETIEANYLTHTHIADTGATSGPSNTFNFGTISDNIVTDLQTINDEKVYLDTKTTLPED